jgi:hypothetical protein
MNIYSSTQPVSRKVATHKNSSSTGHSTRKFQCPRSRLPGTQCSRKVSQHSAYINQCRIKPTIIERSFSPTCESRAPCSIFNSKVKESFEDSNEQFVQKIFTSLGELAYKLEKLNVRFLSAKRLSFF